MNSSDTTELRPATNVNPNSTSVISMPDSETSNSRRRPIRSIKRIATSVVTRLVTPMVTE